MKQKIEELYEEIDKVATSCEPDELGLPNPFYKIGIYHESKQKIISLIEEYTASEAINFGDFLRTQRPDIFYGRPATEQLYKIYLDENDH